MKKQELNADVICLGAPKEAALYFDRVFPVDMGNEILHLVGHATHDPSCIPVDARERQNVLSSLLGSQEGAVISYQKQAALGVAANFLNYAKNDAEYCQRILADKEWLSSIKLLFSFLDTDAEAVLSNISSNKFDADKEIGKLVKHFSKSLDDSGFKAAPMWYSVIRGRDNFYGSGDKPIDNSYFAVLTKLNLVDIDKVSWDAIVEFRKDKSSREALRDLRLFFADNFDGKSQEYVVDSLLSRLHKQEEISKLWGFKTIQRSLGVAVTDKSIVATSLGGLAMAASGAPLSIAATAATVITLGSCVLEFGKAAIEAQGEAINRPTRYLADLKSKLSKK